MLVVLLLAALALPGTQSPGAGVAVFGVVQDQTGAVLAGARVELVSTEGAIVLATRADSVGAFRFDGVAPGSYQLRATFEGFQPSSARLRVGGRAVAGQRLVLDLASISQEVTVSNGAAEVSVGAASNVDAIAVDTELLENLPVFDRDIVATMSRFLDPGAIGNSGVTIVVNGMEVNRLDVGAAAVSRIRLNQDPYSPEYSRPGRGRIEILTKPGSQKFAGELTSVGRDARLNARNAFADDKPPEQRRIFEGFVGGPIGQSRTTSFTVAANDERDDGQALIHALGVSGIVNDTLPQISAESRVTVSVTHQLSDRNTLSIRPNYTYESDQNRGAGGTTLGSAATSFRHDEQQVTYTQQTIFSPTLVHQFQMLVGHEREPTTSRTSDPGIVVAGAFTGGGGQGDLIRTERHINLNESLAWIHGKHQLQAGFQLPDWSRRGFFDRTNFGGTFYFASLDAYREAIPYAFTQQQGDGDVVLLEKQVGVYVKDDWQWRPGATLSYGLRYDWQNYFHDANNLAPRMSFAYAPGNTRTNVLRVGVGVFNDRSGPAVIADVLHSRPGGLTRYVITDPSYPDPLTSVSGGESPPPSTVRLDPTVQLPQTLQWSAGLDHQLRTTTT
ncbi:MAG: carboxypeptidase regulatory-like domain-containing protein, partial [Vicinamibacterales bacterium]